MRNLLEAYAFLEKQTPFKGDCGELCNSACCYADSTTGMKLLPGEESLMANVEGFTVFDSEHGKTLVCRGSCDRAKRPLACRMFPLFPFVKKDSLGRVSVTVGFDPRANICPIARQEIIPDYRFVRAVRRAGRSIIRSEQGLRYMLELTGELCEISELKALLSE